jgi:hypothetical protein
VRGLLARVAGPALLVCAGMAASLTVGYLIARHSLASRAAIASRAAATPGAAPEARKTTDGRALARGPAPAPPVWGPAGAAPTKLAISLGAGNTVAVAEEFGQGRRDGATRSRRTATDGRRRTDDRPVAGGKPRAQPGAHAAELFDEDATLLRKIPRVRAIDVSDPF